jgi:plasmid stabilization system protein ParE
MNATSEHRQLQCPLKSTQSTQPPASSVRSLKKFPQRGRKGREEGTRELLQRRLPHVIAYRVKDDGVEILHIWHPAQDR